MRILIIQDYLLSNGIMHPDLFKRALKGSLPDEVRNNIERLLLTVI